MLENTPRAVAGVACKFCRSTGSGPILVIVGRGIACAAHARYGGEDKRCPSVTSSPVCTALAWPALLWPAAPHRVSCDLPRTPGFITRHATGGARRYAATARTCDDARGQALCV